VTAPAVLVVEDDAPAREFYRTVLTGCGYRVTAVEDGLDALRHVDAGGAPDVVVLDIGLPRLSGHDVKRELQSHPRTRRTPIVVVTGMDPQTLDPAEFPAVVRKPVSSDALLDAVALCVMSGPR
jgi:CheY-like chemotaxis protein